MLQAKSIILLIILFAFSTKLFAQDFNETHLEIRDAVENKDYQTATDKLLKLQIDNPQLFLANNYDYLLARLAEKQKNFAIATANFQGVANRNSILKEYALWHLSQIMHSTGNLMMERLYLQELSIVCDKCLLNDATNKRFVRSHLESENFETAIKLLNGKSSVSISKHDEKTIVDTANEKLANFNKNTPREDLVFLAEAYLRTDQTEKAGEIYLELTNNLPKQNRPDDYALAGAKGLDKLEGGKENYGKSVANLSSDEHLKRAKIYQFNRNFPEARLHYEAIVKNYRTDKNAPVSIYQIARGFGQERNYEKAIEWSGKLQNDFPENGLASAALYQSAGAYASLNNTKEAVSRYEKYILENDDARNLERAYLNIIDAYRDSGNVKSSLEWTSKALEKFNGEMGEAVVLFTQIRIHIVEENWENALNDLNRLKDMKDLGGVKIAGGTNRNEVTFLRGFVLEKLNRLNDAAKVYNSLDDGLKNYYGWRAKERLSGIVKIAKEENKTIVIASSVKSDSQDFAIPSGTTKDFGRQKILQKAVEIKSHEAIADELLFLGLFDEATPELETALRQNLSKNTGSLSDFPSDTAYSLAVFYRRGDMANRAIRYIEAKWHKAPRDFPIQMIPREQLEMLYPKPYEDSLIKYCKENNLDPRFLLSIMRQESRFQADVKSFAAARGLMQFISSTANQMAEEMKIENFKQNDLYNPPTAIRFGSHYLNKIFNDFPNQSPAVAASYNGGEDRMMRWFKRGKSDEPDRYVPEVVYSQTKDYVYKVMSNYRVYKLLYDENLTEIDN